MTLSPWQTPALFWARFLQFGVIFLPLALCHVSFLIAQIRIPRWVPWVLYSLLFLLFSIALQDRAALVAQDYLFGEAGSGRGEINHEIGHFTRRAEPAQRYVTIEHQLHRRGVL